MRKFFALILLFLSISAVSAEDLRFVQITDVRYIASENELFLKTIKQINNEKNIDFVIFTGDNLNKPNKNDLIDFLKDTKNLKVPFYIILGDRDVNKHKDLSKEEYIKTVKKHVKKYKPNAPSYTFEKDGIVFLIADGSKDVIPSTTGYFKEDVLTWMNEQLKANENKNVIILQHFPIIPPSQKETYYTFQPEKYMEVISQYDNVKAIISGHFGVNKEITSNGIVHITTSGLPYYRVIDILDCETSSPIIWAQLKKVE